MEIEKKLRRSREGLKKNETFVLQLGNGQVLTTIPKEFSRWKRAVKDAKLRWSDGGLNRIIIEVIEEKSLNSC